MRFGRLGSTVVTGLSYTRIARQLLIKRPTVISVVQAYLQRGGQLPVSHRVRTQKKLTPAQRAWATSSQTLIEQAALSLQKRTRIICTRFNTTIHCCTLRNYYKASRVSYRRP